MRESRTSGSEGGAAYGLSLPLSYGVGVVSSIRMRWCQGAAIVEWRKCPYMDRADTLFCLVLMVAIL